MDETEVKHFIESALLAGGRPLTVDQLHSLFDDDSAPEKSQIRQAITTLIDEYQDRGISIEEVASGFRVQVKLGMADRLHKLWEDRPPRYSRAMFETLALIAYRQPMTRGEIEEIRGVSVSTNIVRTLLEREWVRVVGHRDVPGRPAMFGTTKLFLDYFGLKKLDDLPPLADLSDWETLRVQLNLPAVEETDDEVEMAEVRELPPIPTADEEEVEEEDDSEDFDLDKLPELIADTGFQEIVASEWPDPNEPESTGSEETEAGDAKDLEETEAGDTKDLEETASGN
jgi:segregation and condensation protein B